MYVPLTSLITLPMTFTSEFAQKIGGEKSLLASNPFFYYAFFAMFLMEEKRKENSQYKLFLDSIPQDFSNHPINFTE